MSKERLVLHDVPARRSHFLDPTDPRTLYWVFAVVVGVGGFIVMNRAAHWFGADLPGVPYGLAAIMRVVGVLIMALGCFAGALATMDDSYARWRARAWFLAANALVFVMAIIQLNAIWGGGPAEWAAEILFMVVLFGVLVGAEEREPTAADYARMTTLFGGPPRPRPMRTLRSHYEEQIRRAARQEERNRLARELHDSIKQQLFVVQTSAATVQARWEQDPAGARSALDQVRGSARDAMLEMEVMLDQLRAAPLENLGFTGALEKQCEALGLRTGAAVSCEIGDLPAVSRLTPGAYDTIFRVAQEALANVARHARATEVQVSVRDEDNQLWLVVEDNGQGFDPVMAPHGMGLANMRERAEELGGQLTTESAPGRGTRVSLAVPCLPAGLEIPDYRLQAKIWTVFLFVSVTLGVLIPEMLIWTLLPAGFLARSLGRLRTQRRDEQARR